MNLSGTTVSSRFRARALASALAALFCGSLHAGESACDTARGKAVLDQCKVCHSTAENEGHSTGPNLFGVVGREAAAMEGFAYSKVLRQSGFTWDSETLDLFLARPQEVLPYNRMAFGGVTDEADRAAVICILDNLK